MEPSKQKHDLPEILSVPTPTRSVEVKLGAAAEEVSRSLFQSQDNFIVAIAQISTSPGRIEENTDKIISYIQDAKKKGAKLVVFPELSIPGYGSMDLFFNRDYVKANLKALQMIREATAGITAIVGFVDADLEKKCPGGRPALYNSAAVIQDGKVLHIQDKTLLPDYDIFFENRYFSPPRGQTLIEVDGVKVGVQICEDLWSQGYSVNVTERLKDKGADLVVNLSASPFHVGKLPIRQALLTSTAEQQNVPIIYANLVGAFDGYEGEVVFDGRSMVVGPQGALLGSAQGFKEDLLLIDIHHPQAMSIPQINPTEELYEALVLGIKDYFARLERGKRANLQKAIIGLSGGIDSALVAALAVDALGPDRVLGITMPSRYSSDATKGDAALVAKNLGIAFKTVPIEGQFNASLETLTKDPEVAALPEDVSEENVQARLRMINLMYYANKVHGFVLNTGNKTEVALNNCTIYGDMVGGFSVLGDVDKDRVYDLAYYINQKHGREVIPLSTIERPPSAELKPNQTDDMVMGAMPQVIAPLVRSIVEDGLSVNQAIAKFDGQFSPELIQSSFRKLDLSEWKRRQAAPAIKVTPRAFGVGRRIPMGHGFTE